MTDAKPTMCLTLVIDQPLGDNDECNWEIQSRRQIRRPLTRTQARQLRDTLDQRLDPADSVRLHNRDAIMWQTRAADTRIIPALLTAAGIAPDLTIPALHWILITIIINPHANW
ncbi:hypothetical protein [Bifidobacterium callimiconis]|uniref:Uncharacterized protein n=1 Tax=Bifidobacterium callimiconis TaxID=2306973 RepID=A0A430FBU4_9BIFI|nr:hypothetical protein [Bifidobacterium callimiconis]RSX50268.1 hypothetical protein D2E23_1816 [Bifidobacterium callimiconis]